MYIIEFAPKVYLAASSTFSRVEYTYFLANAAKFSTITKVFVRSRQYATVIKQNLWIRSLENPKLIWVMSCVPSPTNLTKKDLPDDLANMTSFCVKESLQKKLDTLEGCEILLKH